MVSTLATLEGPAQLLKVAVAAVSAGLLAAVDGLIALVEAAAQLYQALMMSLWRDSALLSAPVAMYLKKGEADTSRRFSMIRFTVSA